MPSNKFLISNKSEFLFKKLETLAEKLQFSIYGSELKTREAFILESIRVLNSFYKSISDPQLIFNKASQDTIPDSVTWNELWNSLLNDLVTIFVELENIEDLTTANFNFVITESNRLTARLKAVSSRLGDYILYAADATKDAFYFSDSFNNTLRVDTESDLLNEELCYINSIEGIVTLPLDTSTNSIVTVTKNPIINQISNGTVGNNQETDTAWNGNISTIIDNNPDTWFEYEKVVDSISDNEEPLLLDLTINLGEPKIINHIRVNPNNFGTKTILKIDAIDTSLDGEVYTSIKDDIPTTGLTTVDEENIFLLAPSTSKFAGQGLYTFLPRKAKYIHIILRQEEPYTIETSTKPKQRYAIGIRDIEIQSIKYKPSGELISINYETLDEVRKVILRSNQIPSEFSDLLSIQWFVSPDNGNTWHEIIPENVGKGTNWRGVAEQNPEAGISAEKLRELIDFNGSSTDTISTTRPVYNLRVKAILTRDNQAFENENTSLYRRKALTNEPHQVPTTSPFQMLLRYRPIENTISIIDPLYGSRGDPSFPYVVGYNQQVTNQQKYYLPFETMPRPYKKTSVGGIYRTIPVPASEWIHVSVDGEEWTHITQAFSNYSSSDKVFSITKEQSSGKYVLRFGNDTYGKKPADYAKINLWFDKEKFFLSADENAHFAKLDFPTSYNKDDFIIERYEAIKTNSEIIPRKATVVVLEHKRIQSITLTSGLGDANDEVDFINGKDEFSSDDQWSVDYYDGILYFATPTSTSADYSISYTYEPFTTLTSNQWDWTNTNLLRDSIEIKEEAWLPEDAKETVSYNNNDSVIDLSQLYTVPGSYNISALMSDGTTISGNLNPFEEEVEFVNGRTELGVSYVRAKQKIIASSSGTTTVSFDEQITVNPNYGVFFTDIATFATDVSPSAPTLYGQYSVDRSSNQFTFISPSNETKEYGDVLYYYQDNTLVDKGLYSVNYKLGKIYTRRPLSDMNITIEYQYTDYRGTYKIARIIPETDWNVDLTNRTITLKDREVIRRAGIPVKRIDDIPRQYIVAYEYVAEIREDLLSLRDYFSPIIKEYAIKFLTKGRIF